MATIIHGVEPVKFKNFQYFIYFQLKIEKNNGFPSHERHRSDLSCGPGSLDESPTPARPMSAWCVLTHPMHHLSQAIFAKAALEGVKFLAAPEACVELRERHAAVLAAFPEALVALNNEVLASLNRDDQHVVQLLIGEVDEPLFLPSTRLIRVVDGQRHDIANSTGISLCLHDVLPPARDSRGEQMFRVWMQASRSQTTPDLTEQHHYWCDLNDVSAIVATILRHPCEDGTYHVSGRRGWTTIETWREFDALVQRTIAGQTGEFGTEHLAARGVPVVEAVAIDEHDAQRARPDLGPLHAMLTEVNGEGWRPKTSLRQSLMMVIAQLSEHQST